MIPGGVTKPGTTLAVKTGAWRNFRPVRDDKKCKRKHRWFNYKLRSFGNKSLSIVFSAVSSRFTVPLDAFSAFRFAL